MGAMSAFMAAIKKLQGAKPQGGVEERVFDPKIRAQMQAAHKGQIGGGTAGYQGFGPPPGAEDVAYSQGGRLPSRFAALARKQKTSVPRG